MAVDDNQVFKALADPSRRRLLDVLYERDGRTLTELCQQLEMTRFGTMKHLRLLEEAALITTRKVGREKLHFLNRVPIRLIHDRWIGKYAESRVATMAALKAVLEGENAMSAATETQTKQVYQVFIKAPAEKVWQAITEEEFTVRYFYGARTESAWKPGSKYSSYNAEKTAVMVDGEILEADPPRKLVQTWHVLYDQEMAGEKPSRVTWEIEPREGGVSKLTVVHDEFPAGSKTYDSVAGGWPWVLSGLKTLLETGEPLGAAG
jgi:uncharacterized protein YndB with AHSA1/START domain/DNA-binding transcriptional ArsR family regulator